MSEEFLKELEELGEDEVRLRLARDQYALTKKKLAQEWVRREEASRAFRVASDANLHALNANIIATKALKIATIAAIGAIIAAIGTIASSIFTAVLTLDQI